MVDDDARITKMLARGLSQVGYECVTAGSADDADRALEREEFDLMLLDIGLLGKSGLEFLPEVNARYPDMAVVMITGRQDMATAVLAMRDGAYDYVAKPVPLTLLTMRVEKALSRRDLFLENKAYREKLENMLQGLNLRLEQSRRELSALNNFVRSFTARERSISEAHLKMESAVTAFGSGIESLIDFAKDIGTEERTPDPGP